MSVLQIINDNQVVVQLKLKILLVTLLGNLCYFHHYLIDITRY